MRPTVRSLAAMMALAITVGLGVATRTHAQTITTGAIAGTVSDANGKSLPGVQISVDSGQMDVTNASGKFVISDILPGTHTVKAALVGFQTVSASVTVTQDLTSSVDLVLSKRETVFTGVQTVVAPLIHKNQTPTLYTVTSKEEQLVRSQPNNLYQYPGAMVSQPGIVPDAQGYPTVRGSKIDEVNYMVDGISVTKPSDNGFGSNLVTVGLDRMNVYTGGYRAELGAAIGGVVNAVIKNGASIRGASVEASTGSWDYSGLVYEQGNVEKNGFNWYVAGNFFRTGYEKNLQISQLTPSADVLAKFIQPLGKDRVTVLLNTGVEHYYNPANDPRTGQPWGGSQQAIHTERFDEATNSFVATSPQQDNQPQGYSIASLTYSHPFTPTSNLSLQGYNMKTGFTVNAMSPWNDYNYFTHDGIGGGRLDYSNQLASTLSVRMGGEVIDSKNYQRIVEDPQYYAVLDFYNRFRGADSTDKNLYLSSTWKPSNRLTADLGVRYDSRTYHRNITLDAINLGRATTRAADLAVLAATGNDPKIDITTPRLGATYQLGSKTLLKASGGRYIQMPGSIFIERSYVPGNSQGTNPDGSSTNYYANRFRKVFDLQPQTSDGVDVGIEQQFGKRMGLALTPFYRKIQHEVVYGPVYQADGSVLAGGSAYQSNGHGHAKGLETKLELRETNGLSGWITYTLQSSKNNSPGEQAAASLDTSPGNIDLEHRVNFDQKHTIYVVGQYRKGSFEINPMLELGSGYPYGGTAGDWVDPITKLGDPQFATGPSGEKLPILVNGQLQSLDVNPYNTGWHKNLSVTFRLYNDKQKSSYYFVQIQNITNSKDVTSKAIVDPMTGALTGYVNSPVTVGGTTYPGYVEYKPYTVVPPIFVLLGVHKSF